MTTRLKLLSLVVVVLGIFSTNCSLGGGGGSSSSVPTVPASVTPQPASLLVNSVTTFTSGGTGAETYTSWSFTGLSGSVGTLSTTRGQTTVYTAPSSPPVYVNQADPSVQGKVTLTANVSGTGSASATFFIIAPAITTGINPSAVTVPLLRTQQFYGYAVGSTNNAVLFQVNGVTGGSLSAGYISAAGLYQAPSVLPMTGNTVTVTAVSAADPNQKSSAVVTLQ